MLYLADRDSMAKWEEPITGDNPTSMEFGPVLSNIYDLTKGDCPWARQEWSPFISDADSQTNRVTLISDPGIRELSKAEINILESVFERFHDFTWKQMKDYSHQLKEYDDPGKSSAPIKMDRIFAALGKTEQQIHEAEASFRSIELAEAVFS